MLAHSKATPADAALYMYKEEIGVLQELLEQRDKALQVMSVLPHEHPF